MRQGWSTYSLPLLVMLAAGCGPSEPKVKSLALVPLGQFDEIVLQSIEARLEAKLLVKVTILKPVPLPSEAYTKPRNRYRADKLLQWLAKHDSADIVLGVTARDISTTVPGREDWGVFGLGYRPGRAAVISSFRLGKKGGVDPTERLRRVAVHEAGHMLGLPHCPRDCVMIDAKGKIANVDAYSEFCRDCRKKLGN